MRFNGRGTAKSRKRGWWPVLALAVALGGGYWYWQGAAETSHRRPRPQAPVAVAETARKDIPIYINGLGTAQAYQTVTVKSQVEGQLIAVPFREGQDVKAGDVLAKIDPRTYQAQLDQAEANKAKNAALLENAKRDLARYSKLGDGISAQALDTQKATVRQLEATLKSDQAAIDGAKTQLSYTTITSPISGRTGLRQVDVGNIIRPGDANGLVVVTQLQPISVMFNLPQQHLAAINEQLAAQKEKLTVHAVLEEKGEPLDKGVLELVDNQIDPATGTVRLKAIFPNEKRRLWPGGFTNVRLLLDTRRGALTVPTVAVQRGPQGSYVFVYKPEGSTVEIRPVKPGPVEGGDTVIEEGLQEGEPVVVDGMSKLQDGSKVALAGGGQEKGAAPPAEEKKHGDGKGNGKHRRKREKE
ncbi:MAG: efflux RND transporter periplasmic adaptor subunit [Alphaproteobacteria bacterium]|nr:efflux RND transporter periplasmic adaptor subunit [Alphaproteobacteria bacterium]